MFKRFILFSLALMSPFWALSQSFYLDAVPPPGWKPASGYADGYARIVVSQFTGSSSTHGVSHWISETSTNPYPVIVNADPYPDDLFLSWAYRLSPGSSAHAVIPAVTYGAGVVTNAVIRVGGQSVLIPSFLKLAPHAKATGAAAMFRGAARGFLIGLGIIGLDWVWNDLKNRWENRVVDHPISDGLEYSFMYPATPWMQSKAQACRYYYDNFFNGKRDYQAISNADHWEFVGLVASGHCRMRWHSETGGWQPWVNVGYEQRGSSCPVGWYVTPSGCSQTSEPQPVTESDFTQRITSMPWPDDLIQQLPDGLPVEPPVLNPSPSPWDKPSPYTHPVGAPVPNPGYDPNSAPGPNNPPRIQPATQIDPAGSPSNPWRFSIQPVNRPVVDGDPGPSNPPPDPSIPPKDPADPDPANPNKPSERVPLLCEVFPHISACAILGEGPPPEQLPEDQINIQISPDSGWGPDSGSCPSSVSIRPGLDFSYQPYCDFASGVRPLILGFAWLAAGLMVVGVARRGP